MDGRDGDKLASKPSKLSQLEGIGAETGIQLDLSNLQKTVRKLEAAKTILTKVSIFAASMIIVSFVALYFIRNDMFFEILSLAWSWQSALVLLIASFAAKSIVTNQTLMFVNTSIDVSKEIGNSFNVMLGVIRAERQTTKGEKQAAERAVVEDGSTDQDQRVASLEKRLQEAENKAREELDLQFKRVFQAEQSAHLSQEVAREARAKEQQVRETANKAEQTARAAHANLEALEMAAQLKSTELEQAAMQNWGELITLWGYVWEWVKSELDFAIENDKRSVVLGRLRGLDLRSPREVIEALLRYGYLYEQEAALAIQMVGIFNSYKTRKNAVDAGALKSFKKLYAEWKSI
jgi:hypothetical protein